MKNLFLIGLVCVIVTVGLMGCGKKASPEHPAGHQHSETEHPK